MLRKKGTKDLMKSDISEDKKKARVASVTLALKQLEDRFSTCTFDNKKKVNAFQPIAN